VNGGGGDSGGASGTSGGGGGGGGGGVSRPIPPMQRRVSEGSGKLTPPSSLRKAVSLRSIRSDATESLLGTPGHAAPGPRFGSSTFEDPSDSLASQVQLGGTLEDALLVVVTTLSVLAADAARVAMLVDGGVVPLLVQVCMCVMCVLRA
jgi:hypothetical protein